MFYTFLSGAKSQANQSVVAGNQPCQRFNHCCRGILATASLAKLEP